ncbi:MAG: 50S ribosome-binding GTPase, partial [Candidatus Hydrogenedentes bacterium]|nr:50S ribosome-binding GTPase [Candidatus Hydrogenedentota bacterium]
MENVVGKALTEFEEALRDLREALRPYPDLQAAVFEGTQEGSDLLTYKLVPHFAGEGCLVAAVTGGTNTGKSTVFNLLLGRDASPMVTTAAATCHPVLAANEMREAQCLESKLVPEFDPRPLTEPGLATDGSLPADALFVTREASLPDDLILLDTPDVDSIEKRNWEIAEHIRAAGDVLIAVLTAEKYKDERVVEHFREAVASARVVIPLMNKANPAEDFEVARKQLEEFRSDAGTDAPGFVVEHDFSIGEDVRRPIQSLDGTPDLRQYLEELDVPNIKERVYAGTMERFGEFASDFIAQAARIGADLRSVADRFEGYAQAASLEYDPAPGKEVGGLFHEFVQSKRGPVRRTIGNTSAAVVRGASTLGRALTSAFRKRATLEVDETTGTEEKLVELHRQSIGKITRDLAARYVEAARDLPEPARGLVGKAFEDLDIEAVIKAVQQGTQGSQSISDEFRQHAMEMLETWWRDHKGKRRALQALDTILAIVPAAIAAPIALHTGGVGVSEAVIIAGPLAAQFLTRVMEYQFGDALFNFLSPWKQEQQETLKTALQSHLT